MESATLSEEAGGPSSTELAKDVLPSAQPTTGTGAFLVSCSSSGHAWT